MKFAKDPALNAQYGLGARNQNDARTCWTVRVEPRGQWRVVGQETAKTCGQWMVVGQETAMTCTDNCIGQETAMTW